MKKILVMFSILAVSVLVMPAFAHAFAFNADGNLSEWGVTPGVYSHSDWTPNAGIAFTVEDGNPATDYLNPGWGGQAFDAEAMYAKYDSTNFYYAIVTGHPPTGASNEKPGDIAFDFGSDGSYEYGIETATNGRVAGGLYSVKVWNNAFNNVTDIKKVNKNEGVNGLMGSGNFVYPSNNQYAGSHYVMEGTIPLSAFGSSWQFGQQFTMSWTETCGNDRISLNVTPTPEPASMALFGIGLAGMGWLRRKKLSV